MIYLIVFVIGFAIWADYETKRQNKGCKCSVEDCDFNACSKEG